MNTSMLLTSLVTTILIDSLWLAALIALACAMAFELLRTSRPATRHAMGMLALVTMLAAPVAWELQRAAGPQLAMVPATHGLLTGEVRAFASGTGMDNSDQLREWGMVCLAQVWLLGVLWMLVRQLRGWWQVKRLSLAAAGMVPPHWQQRFDVLRARLEIKRRVVLCAIDGEGSPFTAYAWRPVVWLPLAWLMHLPPDQVEMLLAHELAHVKRLDWIWNALQCLVEALLFFHPAMWWLSRRVRHERELACDELAVAAGGDAIALAQALHALQSAFPFSPPMVLNAKGGMLVKRIRYLLSGTPIRNNWPVLGGLALLLCSGSLVALELKPPQHVVINMVSSGKDGDLTTPGDYRDLTIDQFMGKPLAYHAVIDQTGHLVENFTEDGKPATIDEGTRNWMRNLASHAAKPASGTLPPVLPVPPAPPAAPALPALAAPPAPPAPPTPPGLSDSAAFQAMQTEAAKSATVQAVAGLPLQVQKDSVHGEIHQWSGLDFHLYGIEESPGGKAQLSAVFQGPKGHVRISYDGEMQHGAWTTKKLEATPAAG